MASVNPWIVRPRPNPLAPLRLYCFPYAGGGAAMYRAWPDQLPLDVEVCAVQLPGRESRLRERPFDRLPPLVAALAARLADDLDRPFAFFGHSMGALVAFELARHLRRVGRPEPLALFVSGRRAPHLAGGPPIAHHLPEAAFVERLRELGGTPEALLRNAELMDALLPLLRADFAVCETYRYVPDAPLACPIRAFGGLDDREAPGDDVAAWRAQTTGQFAVDLLPGGHFFLHAGRRDVCLALSQTVRGALGFSGEIAA